MSNQNQPPNLAPELRFYVTTSKKQGANCGKFYIGYPNPSEPAKCFICWLDNMAILSTLERDQSGKHMYPRCVIPQEVQKKYPGLVFPPEGFSKMVNVSGNVWRPLADVVSENPNSPVPNTQIQPYNIPYPYTQQQQPQSQSQQQAYQPPQQPPTLSRQPSYLQGRDEELPPSLQSTHWDEKFTKISQAIQDQTKAIQDLTKAITHAITATNLKRKIKWEQKLGNEKTLISDVINPYDNNKNPDSSGSDTDIPDEEEPAQEPVQDQKRLKKN